MRRKFLSVVLCVCMMLTMAPFAFAAGTGSSDVAQVGSQKYTSLQDAVNAEGANGATVTLLNDVTLDSTLVLNKSLTLDLNGHKITNGSSLSGYLIKIGHPSNVSIVGNKQNSSIVDTRNNATGTITAICVFGELTVNGSYLTISRGANGIAIKVDEQSPNQGKLTVNSGTISVNTATTTSSQAIQNWGTTIINGGTFSGDVDSCSYSNIAGKMTINGGTFNGDVYSAQMKYTTYNYDWPTASAQIAIKNGTFNKTIFECYLDDTNGLQPIQSVAKPNGVTESEVSVSGGIFTNDSANSIANTVAISGGVFKTQVSGSTQKGELYVYPSTNPVAEIGGFKFSNLADAIYASEANDTVKLVSNITGRNNVTEGKNIVLDLNGKTMTNTALTLFNAGTLVIQDSSADKSGKIVSTNNVAFGAGANSTTTVEYANIQAQEMAILADKAGATITVKDGVFNAKDNAVIGGNGSRRDGEANQIIIDGGTFNGTIQSNGYVACGIYAPWKDNITVNGGTFNITGGAGIVARAGTVTINGGEFNTTGNTTGYVGDSKTTVPCSALVFDSRSGYPAKDPNSKISVQAGKFKSDVCTISFVNSDPSDTNTRLEVTGGYFTSDPSAYCITGKTGVASDLSGYAYMVGTKSTSQNPATVNSATVKAEVSSTVPTDKRQDVTNAANSMAAGASATGSDLEAVVKSKSDTNTITGDQAIANNAVTQYNDSLSDGDKLTSGNVAIVYQSYIDVKVCDIEKATDSTTSNLSELTVELTPMYRVVATKQDNVNADTTLITEGESQNAVVIQEGKELDNVPVKNYEVKLALPTDFANAGDKLSIKHTKENGSIEYYTGTVSTEGEEGPAKTYVTFTTNGFSPFVIYAASANVASIGDDPNQKVYPTLQAAIDAVQNNETITLLKNTNENVTVSKPIKFTLAGKDHLKGSIAAGSRYSMTTSETTSDNTKYTFTYVGGGSSSSISTPTTYNVNVNAATNGAVAADKKTASKGTTVTVTASPSKGYVVDAVKVVDKDGKDVAVTEKDGKYVFTMPASAVTVTGSFKAETPAPVALPFTDVKSGNWFYDAVKYAYAQGLMTGTSATTFAPNGTMNRAMIVTVLYRLEKSPAVTGASKFTDVPAGQWYSDAVAWAAANKIVNGYDETTFGPMNAVTREQMAAILFRYEQVKGLENVTLEENLNRFPDQNKISAYAIPALQWAVGQKIINGNADGTLDPTGTATRAQVAQIFTNLLNK